MESTASIWESLVRTKREIVTTEEVEADILLEEVLVADAGVGRQHGHENLHRIPSTARATSTG